MRIVDSVTARVLLRGAIEQHFLELFNCAGVDQRDFAVAQMRMALAGEKQPLDVGSGEAFATGTGKRDLHIKPLHT